jgi:dolichol-phosphate mannosyltransferase
MVQDGVIGRDPRSPISGLSSPPRGPEGPRARSIGHEASWTVPGADRPGSSGLFVDSTFARGISIVIPAWNEERRLPATLEGFIPVLRERKEPYEIIVVSDGSTDRTRLVGMKYASQGVRVLDFPERLGKGGAVLEGMKQANYDVVGFVDADGPVPAPDVMRLADQMADYDCVVGSRWLSGNGAVRTRSASRRFFSRGWNLMVRTLLNLPLRDTQCGVKFFHRRLLLPVLDEVRTKGWAFDVDLLFQLRRAGGTFKEVPVTWEERAGTKMSLPRAIPAMFLSLIKLRVGNHYGRDGIREPRPAGSGVSVAREN